MNNLILLFGLLLSLLTNNAYSETIFIVSNSVTIESAQIEEIRLIFTGYVTRWKDGSPIKVFTPPFESINNRILVSAIGLTSSQYKDMISRKSYTRTFVEISTDVGIIEAVSKTDYSIGFLVSNRVLNQNIKTIKVTFE